MLDEMEEMHPDALQAKRAMWDEKRQDLVGMLEQVRAVPAPERSDLMQRLLSERGNSQQKAMQQAQMAMMESMAAMTPAERNQMMQQNLEMCPPAMRGQVEAEMKAMIVMAQSMADAKKS